MPSFYICTQTGGYIVEARDQSTAVDALTTALIASGDGQPTFAHETVHVEEIDPASFDLEEAYLVGPEAGEPPVSNLSDGARLTHWSRDPQDDDGH